MTNDARPRRSPATKRSQAGTPRRSAPRRDPANTDIDANPVLKGGMPQALGVRVTALSRRRVVAEMPIGPMHLNLNGRVNGGAIMAFADALGAVGAVAHRPPGFRGGTIESKTNFFAAGVGPVLSAVSVPLHVGRTTSVWQTTIRNADGALVAMVTQTQISVPVKPGEDGRPPQAAAREKNARRAGSGKSAPRRRVSR